MKHLKQAYENAKAIFEESFPEFCEKHNTMIMAMEKNNDFMPIAVFITDREDGEGFDAHFAPIPLECFASESDKDALAAEMQKTIQNFLANGRAVLAYNISNETWVRRVVTEGGLPENWKDLPKEDGLVSYFETAFGKTMLFSWVNKDGEYVSMGDDESIRSAESRFSGILKKALSNNKIEI